jgi:NADH-quinone oxidoreductase subunit K
MNVTILLAAVVGLLAIGLYTVLITRNLIKIVIGLQLLVKGAMLAMIAAG